MSLTHSDIIKIRSQQLANLGDTTDETVEFISASILRTAAQRMQKELGDDDYEYYVSLFETPYDPEAEYHEMTDDQQMLYNLECAETYYCLYYLSLSLKEMVKGDVFYDRFETGTEGRSISPSSIEKINKMRDMYLSEAQFIIDNYGSGSFMLEEL
jgi:hypothetical protein